MVIVSKNFVCHSSKVSLNERKACKYCNQFLFIALSCSVLSFFIYVLSKNQENKNNYGFFLDKLRLNYSAYFSIFHAIYHRSSLSALPSYPVLLFHCLINTLRPLQSFSGRCFRPLVIMTQRNCFVFRFLFRFSESTKLFSFIYVDIYGGPYIQHENLEVFDLCTISIYH